MTIQIAREETRRCRHMGYSFRLAAKVLSYAPSISQDNTYHGLCYTSRGALAGTTNCVHHEGSIRTTHRTRSERSYHGATSRSKCMCVCVCVCVCMCVSVRINDAVSLVAISSLRREINQYAPIASCFFHDALAVHLVNGP